MLKTSPVLVGSVAIAASPASPANGSPASCRRRDATPPSPPPSSHPPDPSSTVSSRQRLPATSLPRPRNSLPSVPCHANASTSTSAKSVQLPPHENAGLKQQSSSVHASVSGPASTDQQWRQIRSPNKRRVSLARSSDIATPPVAGPSRSLTSPSATSASKRARTDQELPKVLPQQYEFCAVEDIVELIAHMLAELIATNDAIRISSGGLTRFHSR